MVVFAVGSLLMLRIDFGRTPCGQPGCNGVASDFISVTLLNYMLLGIALLPFTIFLGLQMIFFGIVHEGRVVLNPHSTEPGREGVLDLRGKLPVLAKLLSRFRACLPSVSHKVACNWYRKAQARYSPSQAPISTEHDRALQMELQACVGPPDMDDFLLFHRHGVTTETRTLDSLRVNLKR